jgi:hypothetical protein
MGDRIGHQVTNDDNARHVVTTLIVWGVDPAASTAPGAGLADKT